MSKENLDNFNSENIQNEEEAIKEATKEARKAEITQVADEIYQKRLEGKESGLTYQEVDGMIRAQGLEPNTPEATELMKEWDYKQAEKAKEEEKEVEDEAINEEEETKDRSTEKEKVIDDKEKTTTEETERLKERIEKIQDTRKFLNNFKEKRENLARIEKDWEKYQGLKKFFTSKEKKANIEDEYQNAKEEYEKSRTEYMGAKVFRKCKEAIKITDEKANLLTKERGWMGKTYDAYKELGKWNLEKLGWKPKNKTGKFIAKAFSARTAISLGLLGTGLAFGAAAPAVGLGTFIAGRALGGLGSGFGSYDLMKKMQEGIANRWGKKAELNKEKIKEINDLKNIEERMAYFEAEASLNGKKLLKNDTYLSLRDKYVKLFEKKSTEEKIKTEEIKSKLTLDAKEADKKIETIAKSSKRNDKIIKGVSAGIGVFVGSGALSKLIFGKWGWERYTAEAIKEVKLGLGGKIEVDSTPNSGLNTPEMGIKESIEKTLEVNSNDGVGSAELEKVLGGLKGTNKEKALELLKEWQEKGLIEKNTIIEGDNIWRSTWQTIKGNPEGYGLAKDAGANQINQKVNELVADLTQRQGGKLNDLVHAGDEVWVTKGADAHISVANTSGLKMGRLGEILKSVTDEHGTQIITRKGFIPLSPDSIVKKVSDAMTGHDGYEIISPDGNKITLLDADRDGMMEVFGKGLNGKEMTMEKLKDFLAEKGMLGEESLPPVDSLEIPPAKIPAINDDVFIENIIQGKGAALENSSKFLGIFKNKGDWKFYQGKNVSDFYDAIINKNAAAIKKLGANGFGLDHVENNFRKNLAKALFKNGFDKEKYGKLPIKDYLKTIIKTAFKKATEKK